MQVALFLSPCKIYDEHQWTETLFGDLELLLAAANDGLQHLVWTDVRLEVTRVPQLTKQLAESLNQNEHLVSRRSFNARVTVLAQEIVAHWNNV